MNHICTITHLFLVDTNLWLVENGMCLDLWRVIIHWNIQTHFAYISVSCKSCRVLRALPSLLPGSLCELWRIWGTWPSCRRQGSAPLALLPMILPGLNVLNLTTLAAGATNHWGDAILQQRSEFYELHFKCRGRWTAEMVETMNSLKYF